jgi:hypothetical protein
MFEPADPFSHRSARAWKVIVAVNAMLFIGTHSSSKKGLSSSSALKCLLFQQAHYVQSSSVVARNLLRLIQLLQILLLLSRQRLSPRSNSLIHPLDAAEANDWTTDTLVDPSQRHMAHLPALLFRELLDSLDDCKIWLHHACVGGHLLLAR